PMRRLCTAAETAVGTWRSLPPGADYADLLHRRLGAPAALEPAAPSEERRAYRRAACLLVRFEPDTLRLPGEPEPSGRAQQELVDDCATIATNPPVWTLRDDVREAALADLPGPAAARRCLEANLAQVQAGPAPERIALAYLSGRPPDARRLDADALAAAQQAVMWLSRIPGTAGIPDPGQFQNLLERVRLLQPLRRLLEE
ncbi:ATP-binding protein, partial [Streptomyces toxytricini]